MSDSSDVSGLATLCTRWSDQWWDPTASLPWAPPGHEAVAGGERLHMVPQGARYVLALLERGNDSDMQRAHACLEALCELQYDEPGTDIHGTFRIFAETPHPPAQPAMWDDYDPNWRQFLGTIFVLVLRRHGNALPGSLRDQVIGSIRLAIEGEPPRRIPPSYANIALMHAWLQYEGGVLLDEPEWCATGEAFAEKIVERFDRFGCFDEYNSPTYYGIDLEALALWRSWSTSPLLAEWGARTEASVWRDLARWYHPGLRNLCGPFTRAYGLDMTTHLGALGLWFADAFGLDTAPLPPMTSDTPHGHDWFHGPYVALLGARIPEDVRDSLVRFEVGGDVRQVIDGEPSRVATGWLADDVMFGAEACSADLSWWDQFKAATAHWLREDGLVGSLEVRAPGPSDAHATDGSLSLGWSTADGDGLAHIIVQRPNGLVRVDGHMLHLGDDRVLHIEGAFAVRSIGEPVPHAHGDQTTIVLDAPDNAEHGSLRLLATTTAPPNALPTTPPTATP